MLTACISFGVAMTTNTHFRGEELKKVWLNRYPADVPTEINPDRYQSLVDMFEQSVARYADQPAFVNMGGGDDLPQAGRTQSRVCRLFATRVGG